MVFLLCWNQERLERLTGLLPDKDYMYKCKDGAKAVRFIRQHKPEVIIADLEVKPSHTMATIEPLARFGAKFIIVDGTPENVAKVKRLLPNAIFAALSDIGNILT